MKQDLVVGHLSSMAGSNKGKVNGLNKLKIEVSGLAYWVF